MAASYIGKNGTLRLYEGTTPTPFYLEAVYEAMDFRGPLARARPGEKLITDRGNHSTNSHYVAETDDAMLEPVEIGFSCRLDDTILRQRLRDALNCDLDTAWAVDGDTWVTTKGLSSGLRPGAGGTAVALPTFQDSFKRCTDLVMFWDQGSSDLGLRYYEVYWPGDQQQIQESPDGLDVTLSGSVYGPISEITALPAGTAS